MLMLMAAPASDSNGDDMAGRLGWVLYLDVPHHRWGVGVVIVATFGGKDPYVKPIPVMAGIPALVLYGLGRAFRYVLSGE
jgi:hypothetical protein